MQVSLDFYPNKISMSSTSHRVFNGQFTGQENSFLSNNYFCYICLFSLKRMMDKIDHFLEKGAEECTLLLNHNEKLKKRGHVLVIQRLKN